MHFVFKQFVCFTSVKIKMQFSGYSKPCFHSFEMENGVMRCIYICYNTYILHVSLYHTYINYAHCSHFVLWWVGTGLFYSYNPELLHWIQGNTSMVLKRSCTRVMYPMFQHELIYITTIFRLPKPAKRASAWRTTWTQRARTTHSTNHILEYIMNVCEWDPNTFPLMAIWTPALGRKI